VKSACAVDKDCTGSNPLCVPGGALGRKANTCLVGGCRLDVDCTDKTGGKCEPVTPQCCNGVTGLYCVYPGTGCRSGADCASGACVVSGKNAACSTGGVCPG
jgi:hypothetical protein